MNQKQDENDRSYVISNCVFTQSNFSFKFTSKLQLCIFIKHKL